LQLRILKHGIVKKRNHFDASFFADIMRRFATVLLSLFLLSCGDSQQGASVEGGASLFQQAVAALRKPKHDDKRAEESERKLPFGQDANQYILTFSEEFDRLDTYFWNDHIWYEQSHPVKNYAVENGMLKIWPQRDANGRFFNRTLDTDGKFQQTYGYFEMEAKLPNGKGTWPAFWLFAHPGERRPEIDIMEAYPGGEGWGFMDKKGNFRPNTYSSTVWRDKEDSAGQLMFETHTDLSTGFHKYAVKWEPHRLTFYFDGKQTLTVEARMDEPMYILLDLWFGGASGEPDQSTPEGKGNAIEVKYVRAWKFRR
jgi:beta-glucanase (GH16 family)